MPRRIDRSKRRLITEVCPRLGIPSNRCYVWDANPFECHCFGRVPLWERLATGGKFPGTRCFVAGPTLQARSLPEKSYARGASSEYKGGPCVILHRSEQCAVKHGRPFPVSHTNTRSKLCESREPLLISVGVRLYFTTHANRIRRVRRGVRDDLRLRYVSVIVND